MYCIKDVLENPKLFDHVAKQTFDAVDTDGSGVLTEDELYLILGSLVCDTGFERPTEDETKEILKIIDKDQSGAIDYKEFKGLFKQLLQILNEN